MSFDAFFSGTRLYFNLPILAITVGSLCWLILTVTLTGIRERRVSAGLFSGCKPEDYTWEQFKERYSSLPSYATTTPTGDRARQIAELREAEVEIDAEVSSALSQAKMHERSSVVGYSPTAVVLIGLLGTLYGLSVSVVHIGDSLRLLKEGSGSQHQAMVQAVLSASDGMSIAFVTTFAGVFAAVILGLSLTLYRKWETHILAQLEETMSLFLMPACQTSEASTISESARALRRLQENLTAGVELLLDSFQEKSAALAEALESRFDSVAREMKDESQQVLVAFQGTIERVNSIVGSHDESELSLVEQVRQLSRYADTLDGVLTEHRDLNQELQGNLGSLIAQQSLEIRAEIEQQAQNLEGFHTKIMAAVEQYEKAQEESAAANRGFAEDLATALQRGYSDLMSQISSISEVLVTGLAEYQVILSELGKTERDLVSGTEGLSKSIDDFSRQISDQWTEMTEATRRLEHHVSESGTALASLTRRIQEQLDTFRSELQEEQKNHRETRTAENESHLAMMLEATSRFTQEVGAQSQVAVEAMRSLVTESGTALSTVGRRLEEQLRHFREQLALDLSGNREIAEADRQTYLNALAEMSVTFSSEVQRQHGEIRETIGRILPALESGFSTLDGKAESFIEALSGLEGSLEPTRKSMASLEASAQGLVVHLQDLRERAELPRDLGSDSQAASAAATTDGHPAVARSIIRRLLGRRTEDDAHTTP